MIKVDYDDPDDEGWKQWNAEAIKRTDVLIREFRLGKEVDMDERFYKLQRHLLMKRFCRKCAYCETRIDRGPVDVEHFRHKGKVTNAQGMVVKVRDNKGKEY